MKKILFIFVIITALMAGCSKDFLDRNSLTEMSNETFWKTESDALLGLDACYDALQPRGILNTNYWGNGREMECEMSDNGVHSWWSGCPLRDQASLSASDWNAGSETWQPYYVAIARCNAVISQVGKMTAIDANDARIIAAEARFIRAYCYNMLVMLYRDVPLITEPQAATASHKAKSTKDEIVTFLITDLKDIVSILPATVPADKFGHATKGAAQALLARVYLWYGYYAEAAQAAKDVMDGGNYSLFPDYKALFSPANETCNEIIFSIRYTRGPSDDGFREMEEGGGFSTDPEAHISPTQNLADAFYCTDGLPVSVSPLYNANIPSQNRDPRFDATIVSKGSLWFGTTVDMNKMQTTGMAWRKWAEEGAGDKRDTDQDYYLLRYGHILLIRAEALVQSGTYTEAEVDNLINQLRARVGMPLVAAVEGTGLTKQQLLDLVKHESRVETAFENLREYDLKRWGDVEKSMVIYNQECDKNPQIGGLKWTNGKSNYFWPLPQHEIDINKPELVQATEWQ